MSDDYSFGAWVRRRRKALDLTQADLARRISCAVITIQKIEADERRPSRQMAELLADQFALGAAERITFIQTARAELAADYLSAAVAGATEVTSEIAPTLTFLFTDIAGSTQLWSRQPATMHATLARHDELLHRIIAGHSGNVFKTVGDAVHAVFADPHAAFAAALAIQRTLQAEPWPPDTAIRVRIALHSGGARQRDGDYFGLALSQVARLRDAGHAGQILISRVTYELVRDALPKEVILRDLGTHNLRDLSRPEQIFQVCVPDLPDSFPPLRTGATTGNNIPARVNSFVGREADLTTLTALLRRAGTRLLTLTGTGGAGKTSLALTVAADLAAIYADGVCFVDLAPIRDPQQVAPTIARTLGITMSPETLPETALQAFLRDKHMLLLLDNFEQVITAAPLVTMLLQAAPRLTALVTSREALVLRGEQEYPVHPLELPPMHSINAQEIGHWKPSVIPDTTRDLTQYDAVALFIERARAVQPDFSVTNTTAPAIAEICYRLDGLPLAIELAAARIRIYTPITLVQELVRHGALEMLGSGPRDMPMRQRTIRSTIAWSYDLLKPEEQTFFQRLGVFMGSWTLEAAADICWGTGIQHPEYPAADLLESLVEHSLVQALTGPDGTARFGLLETVRAYAWEQLAAHGEEEILLQRHATYWATWATTAEPHFRAPEQLEWLAQFDAEWENLHAALTWALTHAADETAALLGLRIALGTWFVWFLRSRPREALQWLSEPSWIRDERLPHNLRARTLLHAAKYAQWFGYWSKHYEWVDEALLLIRPDDDIHTHILALLADPKGMPTAETWGRDSAAARLAVQAGDTWYANYAESAHIYMWPDTSPATLELCEVILERIRAGGERWLIVNALGPFGILLQAMGLHERARAIHTEMLNLELELSGSGRAPYARRMLSQDAVACGDLAEAYTILQRCLADDQSIANQIGAAHNLRNLAIVAWALGNLTQAQTNLTACLQALQSSGESRDLGGIRWWQMTTSFELGDLEAARLGAQFFADMIPEGDEAVGAIWLGWSRGMIHLASGESAVAIQAFRRVLEGIVQHMNDVVFTPEPLDNLDPPMVHAQLALAAALADDRILTRSYLQAAERAQGVQVAFWRAEDQLTRAAALIRIGALDESRPHIQEGLRLFARCGSRHRVARGLELAAALAANDSPIAAARWLGTAAALRDATGAPPWPIDQPGLASLQAKLRATLGDAALQAAWEAGVSLGWERVVAEVIGGSAEEL